MSFSFLRCRLTIRLRRHIPAPLRRCEHIADELLRRTALSGWIRLTLRGRPRLDGNLRNAGQFRAVLQMTATVRRPFCSVFKAEWYRACGRWRQAHDYILFAGLSRSHVALANWDESSLPQRHWPVRVRRRFTYWIMEGSTPKWRTLRRAPARRADRWCRCRRRSAGRLR